MNSSQAIESRLNVHRIFNYLILSKQKETEFYRINELYCNCKLFRYGIFGISSWYFITKNPNKMRWIFIFFCIEWHHVESKTTLFNWYIIDNHWGIIETTIGWSVAFIWNKIIDINGQTFNFHGNKSAWAMGMPANLCFISQFIINLYNM